MSPLPQPITLVKAEGGLSTAGIMDFGTNKDVTSPPAIVIVVPCHLLPVCLPPCHLATRTALMTMAQLPPLPPLSSSQPPLTPT